MYKWKVNGIWKQDANVVGRELEVLAKNDNLNPESVLDLARDENSPLHNLFEWDDRVAAEKYRLGQARRIIQQIVIVNDHPNAETREIRAFVTESKNDGHYQLITTAIEDPDKYEVLLMRARFELKLFRDKYYSLVEFKELFDEIDKFL
jgi:hypothetical protein